MPTNNVFGNQPSVELFIIQGFCQSCLTQTGPLTTLSGIQTTQRDTTSLALNTKIDATLWASQVHTVIPNSSPSNQPLRIGGLGNLCWFGGTVIGDAPPDTDWNEFDNIYSILVKPDSGGDNHRTMRAKTFNHGDGISHDISFDTNWTVCGCYIKYNHDDAIENDLLNQGTVNDTFVDGCYDFLSSQTASSDHVSGQANVVTVKNCVVRSQGFDRPFSSDFQPGWEGFWKWDAGDGGYSRPNGPLIICDSNIFRADSDKSEGNGAGVFLFPPPSKYLATSGSNNFLIWLVPMAVPETVPVGWTVLSGQAGLDKWNAAVTKWKQNHPAFLPDTFPPAVSLFSPNPTIGIGNTTVSGTTTFWATAEDDTGVVGVQFVLDGSNIGSEQLTPTLYSPGDNRGIDAFTKYKLLYDTTLQVNGAHTLKARARDLSGNSMLSSGIGITISN